MRINAKKCWELSNAALGFCLMIIQASYQASESEDLEKFLAVTGLSHALYDKLAQAYG